MRELRRWDAVLFFLFERERKRERKNLLSGLLEDKKISAPISFCEEGRVWKIHPSYIWCPQELWEVCWAFCNFSTKIMYQMDLSHWVLGFKHSNWVCLRLKILLKNANNGCKQEKSIWNCGTICVFGGFSVFPDWQNNSTFCHCYIYSQEMWCQNPNWNPMKSSMK